MFEEHRGNRLVERWSGFERAGDMCVNGIHSFGSVRARVGVSDIHLPTADSTWSGEGDE